MQGTTIQSRWDDAEAALCGAGPMDERVYSSRLLGGDPSLVLHGGGNTSMKGTVRDLYGGEIATLFVKGSGRDLATIDESGFTPVALEPLRRMAQLPALSDADMAAEMARLTLRPGALAASVEAIMHALLPGKFVDHTHADAFLAISNTPSGEARVREVYGSHVVYLPYVMPGFALARACAEKLGEISTDHIGLVLEHHGLVSWGETARESYERMLELAALAEDYLKAHKAFHVVGWQPGESDATLVLEEAGDPLILAILRRTVSALAGNPVVLLSDRGPAVMEFVQRKDLAQLTQQGPLTPDHVLRTKRLALIGRDVNRYAKQYDAYFQEQAAARPGRKLKSLDPAPRVILHDQLGLVTVGRTARDAGIAADISRHTLGVLKSAAALESWQALPASDIFDVEYWDLEQAKLAGGGTPPPFTGEIALVTGAASGIGRAAVIALLKAGAAVVGLDRNADVEESPIRGAAYAGYVVDLSDDAATQAAFHSAVARFGGLDILVLNAGIFPGSSPIATTQMNEWRRVLGINLDSNVLLLSLAHPFLKLSPRHGRVVIVGSKNVRAPGPGAAAYSASKAAMQQLARVIALEWAPDGIRVNTVHPNAVFDTALWTPEILEKRAASYGISIEEYKRNNLLRVEITSADVAEMIVAMCGPAFSKTTGANVPLDGGNDRVV